MPDFEFQDDSDDGDDVHTIMVCRGPPSCFRTADEKTMEGPCLFCGIFTNYCTQEEIINKMGTIH